MPFTGPLSVKVGPRQVFRIEIISSKKNLRPELTATNIWVSVKGSPRSVGIVHNRFWYKNKYVLSYSTGCLKWNPPFCDEYYNFIVQLGQKIKLNPSMGQKQYLKSCFRIRIFWKLCPVGGSDYQNLVKNWRMFLNLSPT